MKGHSVRRVWHQVCCWPIQGQTIKRPPGSSHGYSGYVFLGGVCTQLSPRRASPGGSPRPCSRSAGGHAAGRHQAPPPRERGRPATGRYFPQLLWLAVNPGGFSPAAPARWQNRGSHPAQGSPSPPGARAGAATTFQRSRPPAPVVAPASERETARSGLPGLRLPAGPRAPTSTGQPESSGSPRRGCNRSSAARPLALVVVSVSKCRTARSGASRLQISVGPSGAEQLSVRHVQLRGHAPNTTTG
ncbi:hypothetical protein NDU88_000100 [Pleurodeles waltl]|uniref:Uncharacterized protein n=1 Tax=Pleurodeles waltl TaxID=8319 RepID=A0AAV7TEP6_PLEWA|nr:hypothetical protein NDU88_000100 [Pleurodeles waltl]